MRENHEYTAPDGAGSLKGGIATKMSRLRRCDQRKGENHATNVSCDSPQGRDLNGRLSHTTFATPTGVGSCDVLGAGFMRFYREAVLRSQHKPLRIARDWSAARRLGGWRQPRRSQRRI